MSKRVLLTIALLVALGIGFSIGRLSGARAEQFSQIQRVTYLDAMNALAR